MPGQRVGGYLLGVLLCVGLNVWAGAKYADVGARGSLTSRSAVWVNGQTAPSGTTVYAGDVVETEADSAAVTFTSGASAALLPRTEIALPVASGSTDVNLRRGAVVIRSPRQGEARASVLGTSVLLRGDGRFPALCTLAVVGRGVAVLNRSGHVEIFGAGAPWILPAGKMVKWEAGAPQGGAQQAGKVAAAIPAETVQRSGKVQALPLKLQDTVFWDDTVKTERTGRVRIELLDGSFLNIGARSVFRVVSHNPQTQQTTMEMTLGKMRGEVVKLTRPGANFTVRTQTAVIGVVGTVFLIQATAKFTRVHCIQGLVTVSSINPAIAGAVTLGAGQMTTVPRGLPPSGAVSSPASEVNSAMNQTNVGGPAAGPGGAGAGGGGGVAGATSTITNAATIATEGTTAVLAGASVATLGTTTDTLGSTTTSLTTATSTNNDATTAANAAASISNTLNTATQTLVQQVLSPSTPCGCQ